jgi:hypothetical protein
MQKLNTRQKPGYGIGDLGGNLFFTIMGSIFFSISPTWRGSPQDWQGLPS